MPNQFHQLTFNPSECLLKEGAPGDAAYLITSGKVEIRKGDLGDNPQTLAVVGKGDVIGEMSLFDDSPHMASAIALEETKVSAISKQEFQRRVVRMDPVMRGIFKIMVNRIRKSSEYVGKKNAVNWSEWNK